MHYAPRDTLRICSHLQLWHIFAKLHSLRQHLLRYISSACKLLLQVRPVGAHGEQRATHNWSIGASRGSHTLQLDSLKDGSTRLVSCAPLSNRPQGADSLITRPDRIHPGFVVRCNLHVWPVAVQTNQAVGSCLCSVLLRQPCSLQSMSDLTITALLVARRS